MERKVKGVVDTDIFIDLPLNIIKEHIWYNTILHLAEKDTFKYTPQNVIIYVKDNMSGKRYDMSSGIKIIKYKTYSIKLSEKQVVDDCVYINGKKVKVRDTVITKSFSYNYISEFLDENKLDINSVSFFYDTSINQTYMVKKDYKLLYDDVKQGKVVEYKKFLDIKSNKKIRFDEFMLSDINHVLKETFSISHTIISNGDIYNDYLDLDKVFKYIPLEEDILLVSYKNKSQTKIKWNTNITNKEKIKHMSILNYNKDKDIDPFSDELFSSKGLYIKLENYAVNIYANGKINMKFDKQMTLDEYNSFKPNIKKVIDRINKLDVFINFPSKLRMEKYDYFNYLNVEYIYNGYFTSNTLSQITNNIFLKKLYFSDLMFIGDNDVNNNIRLITKTIQNNDEKNIGSRLSTGFFLNNAKIYDDISIFMRKNNEYSNATTIILTSVSSLNKARIIKHYLNYMWFVSDIDINNVSVSKINKNNQFKNMGIELDARDCQKKKQPTISDTIKVREGSYDLIYKDKRLVCDNVEHIYPGFTSKGSPCCFKKSQKNNPKLINSINTDNKFMVQPTNLKHDSLYRVVMKGDDIFYIKDGSLVPMSGNSLDKIKHKEADANKNSRTYFLPEVSFNKILSAIETKNAFGFSSSSTIIYGNTKFQEKFIKDKTRKIPISHIITTDKILFQKQIGLIPEPFLQLITPDTKGYKPYRVGVYQTNNSFFNCISFLLNIPSDEIIKNIASKLSTNMFLSLDNGNVASIFGKNIKKFQEYILDYNEMDKRYDYFWDLIEIIYDKNIVIFDKDTRNILCHKIKKDNHIFLLKTDKYFEPLVMLNDRGNIKDITIKNIKDIYKFVCGDEVFIPTNIKYQVMDNIDELKVKFLITTDSFWYPVLNKNIGTIYNIPVKSITMRKQSALQSYDLSKKYNINIISQVLDTDKKVVGLLTNDNYIIPVRESPVLDNVPISAVPYYKNADIKRLNSKVDDKRTTFINKKREFEERFIDIYIKKKDYENLPDKEYIRDRIEYLKKTGYKYSKEDKNVIPDNQIIITDVKRLLEYISQL